MKALLFFHLGIGARVAVRSFAPLFSTILAFIMLQTYTVAPVRATRNGRLRAGRSIIWW